MSSIDELITELCPRGVRYLQLGSVCRVRTGQSVSKLSIDQDPGPYPVINSGKEPLGYISSFNTEDDPLGITSRGAGVGSVTWCEGKYFRGNLNYSATILDSKQLNKRFLFHALTFLQSSIQQLCTYQGIPALNKANLEKLSVPVPPLPVQVEIVRILDTFSALEAELEAELEARKQQYDFFRSQLMVDNNQADKVSLGDISAIGTGSHDTKDALSDGKFVFYARGREPLRLDTYDFDEDAIITAGDGVGVGKVFHFASGKYALHQRAYRIVPFSNVAPRYLYHYLRADFSRYLERTSVHASVTSLRRPMFLKYPVALPPLEEQQDIVNILDKFDTLVNDLSVGLPAELAARRQQYEYYRDKLLTFKELEPAS